jgi:hypothetical protein
MNAALQSVIGWLQRSPPTYLDRARQPMFEIYLVCAVVLTKAGAVGQQAVQGVRAIRGIVR